jgi:hypothetical protein
MNEDVVQVVFSKGVLFDITIGRWSALHQMQTKDLLLETLNRKVIYPGHKKLLPEEASYPLVNLEGKIRTFVRKKSMPFPVSGAVFVNFKTLPDMLKGLSSLKKEYEARALDLYNNFEEMRDKQIQVLDEESRKVAVKNGLYEALTPKADKEILQKWLKDQHEKHVSLYPDRENLLKKYYINWRMFRVNPLDETAATLMTNESAAMISEQQEQLQNDLKLWIKEKAKEMHQKLGEAAHQACQLLAENGKLNPKNLKPLFSAFEEFSAVDFADSSFSQAVADIKKKYAVVGAKGEVDFQEVADSVNKNASEFSQLLATMSTLAIEEVAAQAGSTALANSSFKRVVEL